MLFLPTLSLQSWCTIALLNTFSLKGIALGVTPGRDGGHELVNPGIGGGHEILEPTPTGTTFSFRYTESVVAEETPYVLLLPTSMAEDCSVDGIAGIKDGVR